MKNKILSEFYDRENNKKAVVGLIIEPQVYYVDFYEDDNIIETRTFPGKSLHYVEDAAENYIFGILQLDLEKKWQSNQLFCQTYSSIICYFLVFLSL